MITMKQWNELQADMSELYIDNSTRMITEYATRAYSVARLSLALVGTFVLTLAVLLYFALTQYTLMSFVGFLIAALVGFAGSMCSFIWYEAKSSRLYYAARKSRFQDEREHIIELMNNL